ncbi:NFACT RNA binding domain-containing protein [Hathewaya histolytica]|uniref:Rqc2 homolog RqcH n=1 Tax=Hathewaya histolytica TaxID=1498 RepID=A0A4U9RAS7_HATHI|nr:NFACT RNA binding domain-containing protein [Hathewaya histolytica]VTQ88018.1 putative RNA-binding protein, snRNP like protein [Hathewaya histolytica]
MPLDGIYLNSIKNELSDLMINCKIDKINQPEKDEIHLTFNKNRKNHRLLISSNASYPRIHITKNSKSNPISPPMFCMVLRKYLTNSRVISIEQIGLDRILKINFESTDELGFNSIYSLIIEIMGRHSNITLVRERDNVIMDSIKHITPEVNSYRSLYTGLKYVSPPKNDKLNLLRLNYDSFKEYTRNKEFNENFFSIIFEGVSKTLSKAMFSDFNKEFDDLTLKNLYTFLENFKNKIFKRNYSYTLYSKEKSLKDFYCFSLGNLSALDTTNFESSSELLDYFYFEKDKQNRLNSKSSDLQKLVLNNIERCEKKLDVLNKTLNDCKEKDDFNLKGELLTANIYAISKGMKSIKVQNYYLDTLDEVEIKLDSNLTPSENVQWYYKKYNKLKKSEQMALIHIENTKEEITYLNSVLNNIYNIESADEISEIRNELVEASYIKFSKKNSKKDKKSKPYHFISTDGNDIYVGKNNLQNDYLTLKFAHKNDIWLHSKNIPGSHVIIKNQGSISEQTLLEAANLAAYYSKGRESTKIEIDYTEVKNVKKPSGAKPGMVIYYTNKTLVIDPVKPSLNKA